MVTRIVNEQEILKNVRRGTRKLILFNNFLIQGIKMFVIIGLESVKFSENL